MVKKIFATFFLLIFIPVALTTILVWNFRLTLFNKDFVKNELAKGEVYSFVLNELWDKANKSIDLLVAKKVKETKVCTIAQLQKLNLNESEGFPSCKPPNITDQEIVKQLDNKISAELLLLGSELQKDQPGNLTITQNGLEVETKKKAFNQI